MVGSADDARRLAALAGAALRLVNETAAAGLIDAADRGETRVRLPIEPVLVPLAAGRIGRLYDEKLVEALEHAGEDALARACRIFGALGFAVGTALDVERETDVDRVGDVVRSIRIDHLELGFAAAEEVVRSAPLHLLQAVALPAAYLWRARAEAARLVAQIERKALAAIAAQAGRGAASCRLSWRELSGRAVDAEHVNRVCAALRGRGFGVEALDAGGTLRVSW
jgi:hypothetical protein